MCKSTNEISKSSDPQSLMAVFRLIFRRRSVSQAAMRTTIAIAVYRMLRPNRKDVSRKG